MDMWNSYPESFALMAAYFRSMRFEKAKCQNLGIGLTTEDNRGVKNSPGIMKWCTIQKKPESNGKSLRNMLISHAFERWNNLREEYGFQQSATPPKCSIQVNNHSKNKILDNWIGWLYLLHNHEVLQIQNHTTLSCRSIFNWNIYYANRLDRITKSLNNIESQKHTPGTFRISLETAGLRLNYNSRKERRNLENLQWRLKLLLQHFVWNINCIINLKTKRKRSL